MITRHTLRRAVAVPAALTLALGGALFGATAANAAPADLVISTPSPGTTTDSREVTVSGTVQAGSRVDVYKGTAVEGTAAATVTTGNSTAWSTTVTYDDTDAVDQSITVSGLVGFSGIDPQTIAFELPPVAGAKFLTVDSPLDGSTTTSRTVTFAGTATVGSVVTVLDGDDVEVGRQALGNASTYSIDVVYPDDATVAQTATVGGFVGGSGLTPVPVTFSLPAAQAPVPTKTVTLDTPVAGSTTDSRTVTFTGTAPVGSTVTLVDAAGDEIGRANLGNASTFSIEVVFADDAEVAQTVTVGGFVGGSGFDNEVVRSFSLPAAAQPIVLDTPVFTAPVQGEVVVGDRVTFQGTGTPGSDIGVIAVPTAQLAELEDELAALFPEPQVGTLAQPDPQPAPADPADRIIVGEDGTWTVTIAAVPGDYTAVAVSALLAEDGTVVLDPTTGLPVVSAPSEPLEFSIVAAAAAPGTTPAGTTPVASNGTGALAFTGTEAGGALGLAAALALAGTALTLVARRRRALATADADQQ